MDSIVHEDSRLDRYVHDVLAGRQDVPTGLSRTFVQSNLPGFVSVDRGGRTLKVKAGLRLRTGDRVRIDMGKFISLWESREQERKMYTTVVANKLALRGIAVLYEDDDYMVLDKPAGLVVHPAVGHATDTLANRVRAYLEDKGEYERDLDRAGIVHRLDKDVSGVMVLAKSMEMFVHLKAQFESHRVEKIYIAQVSVDERHLREYGSGWREVRGYIARDVRHRQRMKFAEHPTGRADERLAVMYMKLWADKTLKTDGRISTFVAVKLETGRKHQIRATLKYLGMPIIGDTLYQGRGWDGVGIGLRSVYLGFLDLQGKFVSYDVLGRS